MSAISEVLWPGLHKLEPKSQLGGIYANKRGYHNKRNQLPPTDYSVAQFAIDREGPGDEGSAIDWTFPDAQSGNYKTISKYSDRLYAARNDPRSYPLREFFGQTDNDRSVEGWDFGKDRASTSDTSHLWHIHMSIHRKYINSVRAMHSILSILSGQSLSDWIEEMARKPEWEQFNISMPILKEGDTDEDFPGYNRIWRMQRLLGITADGVWGPATTKALGSKIIDKARWAKLFGLGIPN